jgi:hypothetical protein
VNGNAQLTRLQLDPGSWVTVADSGVLVGVGVSVAVDVTVSAGVGEGDLDADGDIEGLLELGPAVDLPWP